MDLNKISNDNAEVLLVEAQENGLQQLVFTTQVGDEFSPSATIKVGNSYNDSPIITYAVGAGITLSNSNLTAVLAYNPADWGNTNALGDASLLAVSVPANKRDFKIKFTINPSFQ
jgi:hypothetical protein